VVSEVTAVSRRDPALCVLLNQDEKIRYGFDEPDELTHAHAVTINRSQAVEHSPGRPLVTSAWPILQRTPVRYP
jgi:exodeoxyribonuclease V alpha subunit